jgi:hypothetical protein
MNKNQNHDERRIRPAVLGLVAVALALICVPLALLTRRPAPPNPEAEPAPAVETPAPAAPAVADVPVESPPAPVKPVVPARPGTLEGEWGIRVASVGLTMAGAAVDFRYTVVDAEKALLLAQGTAAAYVIDQATGTVISLVPPTLKGPSAAHSRARMIRQGGGFPPSPNRLAAGRTNSLLLPNPARILQSGSVVTVVVGDIQTQNVRVE